MPAPKVFWSWQSDASPRETRSLIRDALSAALDRIAADLEQADRPELDHDTRGVPGSPDIVATILAKIEAAAVFVADVTPIAVSAGGKHVANPNVLIELGYAKRALGPERVVLVWNTAAMGSRPEDMPFDMRHRRAPLAYALAEGAEREALRLARADLSRRLEEAVRSALGAVPAAEPDRAAWTEAEPDEPGLWRGGRDPLVVNQGRLDGSVDMAVEGLPRGYAQLVPSVWEPRPDAVAVLEGQTTHPIPLGRSGGLDWGRVRGGFLVYRSNERIRDEGVTPTATRWFKSNGEFWGVASSFFGGGDGSTHLATGYAAERWTAWLRRSAELCVLMGGGPPFHVELGLEGLDGTRWPERGWGADLRIGAIEEAVRWSGTMTSRANACGRWWTPRSPASGLCANWSTWSPSAVGLA